MWSKVFPNEMVSCQTSTYPQILGMCRIFSIPIISFFVLHWKVEEIPTYLAYFTNWGLTLTLIYFMLASLSYFAPIFDKAACIQFQIIWVFNWCITLAFWLYLFPKHTYISLFRASTTHSIPLILTMIDYTFNQIKFIRIQFVFPIGTLILYFFCILMPYTLENEPIYSGINFHNFISFAMSIGVFITAYASLEVGKLFKDHSYSATEIDKPLIR